MLRQPIYLLLPQTQTKQNRQQRKTNKNHLNTAAQKKTISHSIYLRYTSS
jgi:hypothetical protein